MKSKRTRGKTASGRLRRFDEVLERLGEESGWTRSWSYESSVCVELGFGASCVTARQWFERVQACMPGVWGAGVEVDEERVARARQGPLMSRVVWCQGGFDFEPPVPGHDVVMIRAFNVLRQYDAAKAPGAHEVMASRLVEGGVLIEGSCDRDGAKGVVHLMRVKEGKLSREGLLCVVDAARSFAPRMLRDWLPQDLRRGVGLEHPVHMDFLGPWMRCFEQAGGQGAQRFAGSVEELIRVSDGDVYAPAWMRDQGAVLWRPSGGVTTRDQLPQGDEVEEEC